MRAQKKSYRDSFHFLREYLIKHGQVIGRNMAGKNASEEVTDGNEGCVIRH